MMVFISALVGPPTNIRVEATSNSSAVVQWDFENGQVDGFVVKYMHEPGGRSDTERWTARTVMSPNSRHLEVPHLTAHKPYAFCVLAIKNNQRPTTFSVQGTNHANSEKVAFSLVHTHKVFRKSLLSFFFEIGDFTL
ncbi:unnamed protein product [Strongylus vulgaris]|uniref:Fibronectin type-III domain-containing protein n=1 Tax=Strongylus vulgaris TaxID=40348 RepID=A0A3P7KP73_STRVU|nr:unnamed protein product [Strongylus vulgaris]